MKVLIWKEKPWGMSGLSNDIFFRNTKPRLEGLFLYPRKLCDDSNGSHKGMGRVQRLNNEEGVGHSGSLKAVAVGSKK